MPLLADSIEAEQKNAIQARFPRCPWCFSYMLDTSHCLGYLDVLCGRKKFLSFPKHFRGQMT
jgi:hypothetical protein